MHSAEARRDIRELDLYLFGSQSPIVCDNQIGVGGVGVTQHQQSSEGDIETGYMEVNTVTGEVSFHERFGEGNLEKGAENRLK